MYNILLTDDEQIVIDTLSFIIQKEFDDKVCIFSAYSGSEAVQIFNQTKIDIAFVDINMPGLTGLEAIREMKAASPNSVMIVLSAFDRFQYAQEAIDLGVFKYLTKPVNRNLVTQTLRDAMMVVDSNRGKLTSDLQLKEKLNFVSPIVESDFIYSSIFSTDNSRDMEPYLEFLNISSEAYFYCCIELPRVDEKNRSDLYDKVRECLRNCTDAIVGPLMMNRVICYVPCEVLATPEQSSFAQRQLMNILYRQLSMKIGSNVRIGVSGIEEKIGFTQIAYNQALAALAFCNSVGGVAFIDSAAPNSTEELNQILNLEQQILRRLQAGDEKTVQSTAALYFPLLWRNLNGDVDSIKDRLFTLLVTAKNTASTLCSAAGVPFEKDGSLSGGASGTFAVFKATDTGRELEQFVLGQLCAYCITIDKVKSLKQNPIIEKTRSFIQEHLSDGISLEEAAAYVNVNPFYLSKLFKEETGENFIDYVTDLRLEKAKELLKEGKLSIKELSWATGYPDQNYFSKVFRKKFGVTPTEFRNL